MADMPKDNPSAALHDVNHFNEDFEKLERPDDTVPDQDEKITSTSFTGGEEPDKDHKIGFDAYQTNPSDQLLSFDDDVTHPQPSAPMQPVSEMDPLFDLTTRPKTTDSVPVTSSVQEALDSFDPLETSHTSPEPAAISLTDPKDTQKTTEMKPSTAAWMKNIDPREFVSTFSILDLVYWKDVKKTGVVFGSMLFLMLSLAFFSVLSVVAYLSLAVLTVTLSFRVYKNVMSAVQKSGEGHPFKQYFEMNTELSDEKVEKAMKNILSHLNCTVRELRRLFLVEDYVDSVKFGLLLWVFTYIGSWFNGMTLIIMGLVILFTLPKVYDTYKVQIDEYVNLACTQLNNVMAQVQAKLPFLKKKTKTQ